ncbi:MAG: RCC1 domain-containing protein, partial [Acidobacteriota bacterium]
VKLRERTGARRTSASLVVALSAGIVVATVMLLAAFSGRSGAATPGPVQAIATGGASGMALGSGLEWGWGFNRYGEVGNHTNGNNIFPPVPVVGPSAVGYFTGAQAIAAGGDHSLALRNDGTVWAWGRNDHGQLGLNTNDNHTVPYQVHGPENVGYLSGITAIAAGSGHSLAVGSDGHVYSWGWNVNGQLGVNSNNTHWYPVPVHGPGNVGNLTGITAVAGGYGFSLALKDDGTVWAWGDNGRCQLGNPCGGHSYTPVQVRGPNGEGFLTDVVAIAAGGSTDAFGTDHSLALRNDGTVWAWGDNTYGELGVNSNDKHWVPQQVHGPENVDYLSGITGVAAGSGHSVAVGNDGHVYTWGQNLYGQLGINSNNTHWYPVPVHGPGNVGNLTGIEHVAAGGGLSLALRNDGTVWGWGDNRFYQVDRSGYPQFVPVQVTGFDTSTPPDTTAPQTKITQHPPRVVIATGRKAKARFAFTSSERGSTVACKLDKSGWRREKSAPRPDKTGWHACESPRTYRVKPGRHTFKVRATDRSGNTDSSAARWRWKVKRP